MCNSIRNWIHAMRSYFTNKINYTQQCMLFSLWNDIIEFINSISRSNIKMNRSLSSQKKQEEHNEICELKWVVKKTYQILLLNKSIYLDFRSKQKHRIKLQKYYTDMVSISVCWVSLKKRLLLKLCDTDIDTDSHSRNIIARLASVSQPNENRTTGNRAPLPRIIRFNHRRSLIFFSAYMKMAHTLLV